MLTIICTIIYPVLYDWINTPDFVISRCSTEFSVAKYDKRVKNSSTLHHKGIVLTVKQILL